MERYRGALYKLLVLGIIGSMYAMGRTQEMEDRVKAGFGPPTPVPVSDSPETFDRRRSNADAMAGLAIE